jgi:hypothetical protein
MKCGFSHTGNLCICKLLACASLVMVFGAHALLSATAYWTAPAGGDFRWTNDANWSTGRAPVPGDSVVFGTSGKSPASCDLDADAVVARIIFRASYTSSFDFDGHFLSITGDTCDLRSGGAIVDGSERGGVEFAGAGSQVFFPGAQSVLPSVVVRCQPGGKVSCFGAGFKTDTLAIASGTLHCGQNLSHAVGSVQTAGGALDLDSSTLFLQGATINLSGLNSLAGAGGTLVFTGALPQKASFPADSQTFHCVVQNGAGGTTLSGCDLAADTLSIRAGALAMNGYSATVIAMAGDSATASDTLSFGTSAPSLVRARGNVSLDQLSVAGDVRLELSGDRQDLRLPKTFHIVKLVQRNAVGTSLITPTGATLTIDTLVILSGTLDLGGGSIASSTVVVRSLTAAGGGVTFGGSTITFTGDTADLSRLSITPQQQDGGIEFGGANAQVFVPRAGALYPSIIQSGLGGTTISSTGFSCARLAVVSGVLHLGPALSHAVSSRLFVRGCLDFGTSTLSIAADSVDLSGAASIVPGNGTLSFTKTSGTQFFAPKLGVLHPNIIKARGGTVVLCGPCFAKKLWISGGTFDCGNYKCELTGFSAIGGSLAVGADSLIVAGNALFSGLSGITTGAGPVVVRTSAVTPVAIFSCGSQEIGNLVLFAGGTGGSARILVAPGAHRADHCTFTWNRSQDSAIFDFRQNNASLAVRDSATILVRGAGADKGCIYMGNGTWTFAGDFALANYARDSSRIVFAADTGTQTLSAPLPLGDMTHCGAGTLQLLSNVKCRSFAQTSGALDFNGNAISAERDFSIVNGSDTSIVPSKRGWKAEALGSVLLCGGIKRYLSVSSAAGCTLSAAGTLRARYTVLRNCKAADQKGMASKCVDSLGNGNWFFSNKPVPPAGISARRGNGAVAVIWNRSPAPDALRYCVYSGTAASSLTKRDSTDSPGDTARTFLKLTNGQPYYFCVTVVDSSGAESTVSSVVSATPDSGLLGIGAARVSFAHVSIGRAADSAISLWNNCTDTLVVSSVRVTSPAFSSSLDSCRIAPRQIIFDTLAYRPRQPGTDSAFIVILSNALSSPDTIRVAGTVTAPRLCAIPDTVSFDVAAATRAPYRTVVIKNAGNDTLRISQIARLATADCVSDSLFILSQIPCLAPGDSCVDTVQFAPKQAGAYSAMFLLKSNCATPLDTLFLFGKFGAAATQPAPAVAPKDFAFQEASVSGRCVVFRYALPTASRVSLDAYNAIGRFIERPLEGMQDPREYQFSWDGSHLSRGIYFCRFKAADSDDGDAKFTKTVRIVFSK